MTNLEQAQQALALVEQAIAAVKFAAAEEQKLTHSTHIDKHYREALERLETKRLGAEVLLKRVEIIGR